MITKSLKAEALALGVCEPALTDSLWVWDLVVISTSSPIPALC